ncbi:hypothetical protein RRG08_015082 [Elysia crispata]|uniref:RING-type domain-containing protein n=1 Tax=Elysia crispata TaxID=231223 RepID=A0AAE1EA94_9GAST|nr:hypothetical protein RRG08_015082 [Elysia crispata]
MPLSCWLRLALDVHRYGGLERRKLFRLVAHSTRASRIKFTLFKPSSFRLSLYFGLVTVTNPIRRTFEKKKRRAQIFILYFFKTIHHQVVHYGRDGQDKAELVKEVMDKRYSKLRQTSGESKSALAHTALREGRLEDALQLFDEALRLDPFSSQDYISRAETNIKMEKFLNALPDCWRAVVLDKKHTFKSCYHASQCFLEMGNEERAMKELNIEELEEDFTLEPHEKKLIKDHLDKIQEAIAKRKADRLQHISELKVDCEEDEKTSVVFRKLQCEGSTLYLNKKFSEAADKFHEALEMISSFGLKSLETQLQDSLLLNYCYGLACVRTRKFSNLQYAIEKFKYVICHSTDFPASHYGLGLAYKSLSRFSEALVEFQRAMEGRKSSQRLQWPQTVVTMEETDPDLLQKLLKNEIQECRYPPKPDAICKFHLDANSRAEIYRSDPDYKGFVRLLCNCKCCIEFHSNCWKMYRHNMGKHIDKDMLDKECPTPNCWGVIINISRFKPNMDNPIVMTSSKKIEPKSNICKPMIKMKTTNALKLQKKTEKKLLRKERREELRKKRAEEEEELEVENLTPGPQARFQHYGDDENDLRNLNAANQKCMVLMAKEPDALAESKAKQKVTKLKKKKEKTKQVLTFDLQFSADKDKELLGVNSLDCEEDFMNQPGLMGSPPCVDLSVAAAVSSSPCLLPTPVILAKPSQGNGLLPLPLRLQPTVDIFMQNLIECFVTVLQGGPVEIDSAIVRDILGSVPSETQAKVAVAGGIAAFLSCQPQFVVAAGKVGLAKGGPGLLSNGPATLPKKIVNGGGAGLLETPPFPIGSKDTRNGSIPWSLPNSSLSNSNQKGLLGSFPQTPQGVQNFLTENLKMQGTLNPSAEEFVPGLRKNSVTSENGFQNGVINNSQEVEEEDEDVSGEFVTVTHKKSSHLKSLKGNNQRISSDQNGITNMFSALGEERSDMNSFNSVVNASSATSNSIPNHKSSNSLSTVLTAPLSSTTTATMAAPPPPLPITSIGAANRRRAASDTSSTVSEEVRASSPASSVSLVSQGSSNSNPTSSSANQAVVCPPQPLKGSGLNLPKRSKRRVLWKEKIASLASNQPSVSRIGTSTQHVPRAKSPEIVDDIDSIDSGFIRDKDSTGELDSSRALEVNLKASFAESSAYIQQKNMFSVHDIDEESTNSDGQKSSSLWDEMSSGTYLSVLEKEPVSDNRVMSVSKTDSYFPGVYDYGSSLEYGIVKRSRGTKFEADGLVKDASSLQTAVGQRERSRETKFEADGLVKDASSLQTAVGQRDMESRVLRNLGVSSHSPSPPLTSTTPLQPAAENRASFFNSPSAAINETTDIGLMFDSSGNFRSALADKATLQDLETFYSSSDEFLKGSSKDDDSDPWAKSSSPMKSAKSKFGMGDALYGSSALFEEDPYFPSHEEFPLTYLSHVQDRMGAFSKDSTPKESHLPPTLFSAPGMVSTDRNTWSPLSSDSHQADAQGQSNAGYQAWPSSFAHGKLKDGLEESDVSLALFKNDSQAPVLSDGKEATLPSAATSKTASSSQVAIQKFVTTATASVNTELTGEKLKSLQQKFYEVKQERDSLRAKVKAEQEEKEFEKIRRQEVQNRLSEMNTLLDVQQKNLEASNKLAEAAERERDSLSQALKKVTDKACQLDKVKSQLEREVLKVKSHEKQILNLQLQTTVNHLETRRKEACSHIYKLDGLIHRIRNSDQVVDQALTDKHTEWEAYVKGCEKAIEEAVETNKIHLKALEEGESLEQLLPLKAPVLPPVPKPPSEQSLVGHPRTKVQSAKGAEPVGAGSTAEAAEDDETAFLKMVFQGSAAKQEKTNQPRKVEAPTPLRLPPGLPKRPLSQGPIPLNHGGLSKLPSRPTAPSPSPSVSSSSSSSTMSSIKLPLGHHVTRPSLASIAATMVPHSNLLQSQAPGQQRSAQPQQMSVFERLVQTIQETFPDHSRSQIQRIVEELRRDNGGSLASISFDNLARCIAERIVDGNGQNMGYPKDKLAGSHQLQRGAVRLIGRGGRDSRPGSPSEMTCTICHDDSGPGCGQEVRVLDCGHRFHEDCIQSWLRVNQTCPNCRSHSLLEEDFPSLRKF